MALPIQSAPSYNTVIPSTGEKINFRPFLVKEQKALLLAQQSNEQKTMVDTLKSVISSCTMDKININTLAIFDLEYLFTQIRAKSVGEIVELMFNCDTCEDEKAKAKVDIDLTSISITKNESHTKKIPLFDDVGVVMKYPNIDMLEAIGNIDTNSVDSLFAVLIKCIDYIYNGEEIFYSNETKESELAEFINNLDQKQFQKIQNFFQSMPKLSVDVSYDCPICKKHHEQKVEGMNNFF